MQSVAVAGSRNSPASYGTPSAVLPQMAVPASSAAPAPPSPPSSVGGVGTGTLVPAAHAYVAQDAAADAAPTGEGAHNRVTPAASIGSSSRTAPAPSGPPADRPAKPMRRKSSIMPRWLGGAFFGGPSLVDDSDDEDLVVAGAQSGERVWEVGMQQLTEHEQQRRIEALMNEPKIQKAFEKFDIDGSGNVTVAEVHQIMSDTGNEISEDEMQSLIKRLDKNGDGDVDLNELCTFLIERREELQTAKDESWMIEHAFTSLVWPTAAASGELASSADEAVYNESAVLTVADLKSVFMRRLGPQLGLSKAEFAELLGEFGLDPQQPAGSITLGQLRSHPAFTKPTTGPLLPAKTR